MALNLFRAFRGLMSSRNRLSARPRGENPDCPGRGSKLDPDQYATRLLRMSIFGHRLGSADSSSLLPLLSYSCCGIALALAGSSTTLADARVALVVENAALAIH